MKALAGDLRQSVIDVALNQRGQGSACSEEQQHYDNDDLPKLVPHKDLAGDEDRWARGQAHLISRTSERDGQAKSVVLMYSIDNSIEHGDMLMLLRQEHFVNQLL